MDLLSAILYGALQGAAEFLPVSSSGHLALLHQMIGTSDTGHLVFDVLLHLATLLAVAIVYRKDLLGLLRGGLSLVQKLFAGHILSEKTSEERLFLLLCVSSLPLLPAALLADRVEAIGASLPAVGALLICNGILLLLADRLPKGRKPADRMTFPEALFVGCTQMFGILPGISRSGATVTGCRLAGTDGEQAVHYSFLLSFPAIFGAFVLKLPAFVSSLSAGIPVTPYLAGFLTAFAVGLLAVRLLKKLSKRGFGAFGLYTILIGAFAVAAHLIGWK